MRFCSIYNKRVLQFGLLVASIMPLSAYASDGSAVAGSEKKEAHLKFDAFTTSKRESKHSKHDVYYRDSILYGLQDVVRDDRAFLAAGLGLRNIALRHKEISSGEHAYGSILLNGRHVDMGGWVLGGGLQIDLPLNPVRNVASDSRYMFMLEGLTYLNRQWAVALGVDADTGMRATTVKPIIGVRYTNKNWIVHAVYPEPKIIYKGFENLELALVGGPIFTQMRAKRVHHHKNGVALLKGTNAEFRLDYEFTKSLSGWIGVGRLFNQTLRVGDKNFHDKKTYNMNASWTARIGISYTI